MIPCEHGHHIWKQDGLAIFCIKCGSRHGNTEPIASFSTQVKGLEDALKSYMDLEVDLQLIMEKHLTYKYSGTAALSKLCEKLDCREQRERRAKANLALAPFSQSTPDQSQEAR